MTEAVRVHLFPVRHHSPRTSVVLEAWLERVAPAVVLIEGPADATDLIDVLTHPDTAPPVALLAYRTDGVPGAHLWPFAAYSPEYVALAWARRRGARARFIDMTAGQSIAYEASQRSVEAPPPAPQGGPSVFDAITARAGLRSFEEFWEAGFEAPQHQEPGFRAALLAFADLVREERAQRPLDGARDAIMLAAIEAELATGTPPERIVAVLGAAHVAALVAGDVDRASASLLDATVEVSRTVIPYSFPRLAEQTGYGAGNRAPSFYERAYAAGGDYRRAALEVLVDFTDHLRLRGFAVSLADTIEAYRLACQLGDLRGKSGPGLDEVRDATIATLCRGESKYVDTLLWPTVVGKAVGRVSSQVGRNSLQEEFWSAITEFKLARSDEAEVASLRLTDPVQVEISVFLHRLRTLGIPYASLTSVGKTASAETSSLESLSRVREAWQCQWTPSTEVALVEAIVHGESFRLATERLLTSRVHAAARVAEASIALVDAVVAHASGAVGAALAACERLGAHDDDVPSLATACRALAGLVSYGSSRDALGADKNVLEPLLTKMFARATLRFPLAASTGDEGVDAVVHATRILHELAQTQAALVDHAQWIETLREVARSFAAHPRCAGTAAGLLVLARAWTDAELDAALRLRMTDASESAKTAEYLIGFLSVNALAIVKNASIVGILDAYLQSLDQAAFRDVVPVLRRAFAELGKTERRYLVENLVDLRGHAESGQAAVAARVMSEADSAQLKAMDTELAKAMDDLDDLL